MPGRDELHARGFSPEKSDGQIGNRKLLSRVGRIAALLLLCGLPCTPRAIAQVNSNTVSITLNATLAETLTVAATPSTVTFTLVAGGSATGSPTVTVTTTWVLGSRTAVNLFGYFATTTAALTGGGNNIPTSEVLGQLNGGAFNAFTATGALGPAGAGLDLFTQSITSANKSANRSDTLALQINLTSQPQLPAGTYTGTLTLQAQAT